METTDKLLQYCNQAKRACRHLMKATRALLAVRESLQRDAEGKVIAGEKNGDKGIPLEAETGVDADT